MQFGRQNPNQGQPRPLPPRETFEELLSHMLQGGLDAIDGGDRQRITSN